MHFLRYMLIFCFGLVSFIMSQTITLKTKAIERTIAFAKTPLHTTEIVNRLTGEHLTVRGEAFAIQLFIGGWKNASFDSNPKYLTSHDFSITDASPIKAQDTVGHVVFLHHPLGIDLQVRYYLRRGQPELYKDILLTNHTGYPILIDFIAVEAWNTNISQATHQGFGQPVYFSDFYTGIAYPTGENRFSNGHLTLQHVVGQSLLPGQTYQSHPAVLGAAPSGRVAETFLQYIERIKAHPTRPFLLYNSWYDIRRLTDANCVQTINAFHQYMSKPYGLKLDAFVLDDGWDNYQSCWDISREQFPQEFRTLQRKLANIHSRLGLWASPWGGYDQRRTIRVNWAKSHGYETSGDMLCIAGQQYYQCFKQKLLRYQKEYGIRFFKLDGLLTRCNATNHGHLPGVYSREQAVANFIDLMQAMRQQDPEVFIDITVGTWLSPWWLQYADCVWMTGADYAYTQTLPLYSERDKAITYRDQVLHDNYQLKHYQFPLSGLMTHGIIKGRLNLLGGKNETLRQFTNNTVLYFSRGVMMWELYITPSILSKAEWDNLAQTIRWAYANQKLLQHSRFILGNPGKGEIYGYLHNNGQQLLLTLRNPAFFPQTVHLPLLEWLPKTWKGKPLLLKIYYPYLINYEIPTTQQTSFPLQLEGNEILVLEILPRTSEPLPLPLNTRYHLISRDNHTEVVIFSPTTSSVSLLRPRKSTIRLLTDGVQLQQSQHRFVLQTDSLASVSIRVTQAHLNIQAQQVTLQFQVNSNAFFKEGQMLALWESPTKLDTLIATAQVNHTPQTLTIKRDGDGKWWWIALPVTGSAEISLAVQTGNTPMIGRFSAILEATMLETPWARYRIRSPQWTPTTQLPYFKGEHRVTVPIIQPITIEGNRDGLIGN